MATRSTESLGLFEEQKQHRPRSGSYVDFLQEHDQWQRRERERERELQLQPYPSTQYVHRPRATDRLEVPVPHHMSHRRVRSHEQIGVKKRPTMPMHESAGRGYQTREQTPTYDLAGDTTLPTQLPVRVSRDSRKKVDAEASTLHQTQPTPAAARKSKSSITSVNLESHVSILQSRFSAIGLTCAKYIHVEAAKPQDLTFAKIAEEVGDLDSRLRVWGRLVNIEDLARRHESENKCIERATQVTTRMLERVDQLLEACSKARPKDLKLDPLPELDDEDEYDSSGTEDSNTESSADIADSMGFIIQSQLHSIRLHFRNLTKLTRPLQEDTSNARDEVVAVQGLIKEVAGFFGSDEALRINRIDTKYAGRKALEEARDSASSRP